MGLGRRFTVLILWGLTVSSLAWAKDPRCVGIIREVVPLGGLVSVDEVETINLDASQVLSKYNQNLSVQQQLLKPGTYGYLAIRDEEIAGFIVIEKRARVIDIRSIAVAKHKWGQGIGRDLINYVFEEAKQSPGVEEVRVLVAATDTEAKHFFERTGLVAVETIPERFNARQTSGVLLKWLIPGRSETTLARSVEPQLQLAPAPKKQTLRVATAVLPATFEQLLALDPTLKHARD